MKEKTTLSLISAALTFILPDTSRTRHTVSEGPDDSNSETVDEVGVIVLVVDVVDVDATVVDVVVGAAVDDAVVVDVLAVVVYVLAVVVDVLAVVVVVSKSS